MGSSSLKAEVNAFDRLQIVRDRNSSYFGSKYKSWTVRARCFGASSLPSTNASWMATFAVTSVSSLFCQASTCFRIGSKLRCIRSTPTAMQSRSENDFECFASTGVNTPPIDKMTDDVQTGSYVSADSEVVPKSTSGKSSQESARRR